MTKNETLKTLEFDRIVGTIARFASSETTRQDLLKIVPFKGREEIEKRFGQVEEIRGLGRMGVSLGFSGFHDILPFLEKVRPSGALLDPRDLA
ncbi:MAG: endonuclease MutS2, partial [Deltaproteobacteria bacterium]